MTAHKRTRIYRFIVSYNPDFRDLALAEIERLEVAKAERELAPGVLLIAIERPLTEVADEWRAQPPVFIRHVCPVDVTVALKGAPDDLARLERAAVEAVGNRLDPLRSFSVQSRVLADLGYKPYDINTRLAAALTAAGGASVDVRRPRQVVSVVCAIETAGHGFVGYVGLSNTEDNLSDWAGGMRRYAREPGQVSRSEFKLLEALETFRIDLPPRGVALDLGAAPGGWTRVLRQRGQYVTAVDPGELHPSVKSDPGVRHLRTTAEEYLAQGPDRYDLIVNDMRMDGRDSARLMAKYAEYLYPHGQVIMTLKLPERNRRSVIDHSLSILARAYVVAHMRQLFHNRSELTLHLAPMQPCPESEKRTE